MKMLGTIGYVLIALGFTWILDAYLGFRIEMVQQIYPFDIATRQMLGIMFLAGGTILEWLKTKRIRRHTLNYM